MDLPPCTIILFGATGDLTRQKLIPALYHLHKQMDSRTRIVLIGRKKYTTKNIVAEYRKQLKAKSGWETFAKRLSYYRLEFHDGSAYDLLKKEIAEFPEQRIFYLATPQGAFPIIIEHLNRTGLARKIPEHRVVFEKPFGSDLRSARNLNKEISRLFTEEQIYRVDHYLGKSFVQQILTLRFANPLFEYNWSREFIDNVQIVVSEISGIGTRGEYYDKAGAIRDMIQNHMLQLLALVAMEPPKSLSSEDIRNAKSAVLKDVQHQSRRELSQTLIVGQYDKGNGIPAYRSEPGINAESVTETYACVRLNVKNRRWKGVPFYLRTGKAMQHHYAEVAITMKRGPWLNIPNPSGNVDQNILIIRIQPDEGLRIGINLADNTGKTVVTPHVIDFVHETEAGTNTPEAYELLLSDIMLGDQTLFARWDFVEESWKIVDNLREGILKIHPYVAGTHGPDAALELLKKDGKDWVGDQTLKPRKKQ